MPDIVINYEDYWISKYDSVFEDIMEHKHTNYVFPGGRGSTKSSFISLMVPLLLMNNPDTHAVVFRKVGNTLKNSVYSQVQWAIGELGLNDFFIFHVNPLEIIFRPTQQRILFLGLDDPNKAKSIKFSFGYIAITWFEELDQFSGPREIRKVLQSTMRGGQMYWNFKSYNPPISINNWANEATEEDERLRQNDTLVVRSTYLDVPRDWLGEAFITEAEFLRDSNLRAYQNEYLGIPVGTGGNVFSNVEHMLMDDELINTFDTIYNGLDWGFANDPNMYTKMYFDSLHRDLYIYGEHRATKESNQALFEELYKKNALNIKEWDKDNQEYVWVKKPFMRFDELITADEAEPKSIADLKSWGCFIRGAKKGPDSIRYGIKWLQSLRHIYIDKFRCPYTYDEFISYEYERDRDGNIISSYPDANNHSIDSVRYAMNRYCSKRGN